LEVTDDFEQRGRQKRIYWHCICECGNETWVATRRLKMGTTKSCDCFRREKTSQTKFKNLSKQKFGKLTVTRHSRLYPYRSGSRYQWLCQCECGAEKWIASNALLTANSLSCGCSRRRHGHTINNSPSSTYHA